MHDVFIIYSCSSSFYLRVLGSIKSFEVDKVVEAQKDSIISVKVGSEAFTKFSGTKVCVAISPAFFPS